MKETLVECMRLSNALALDPIWGLRGRIISVVRIALPNNDYHFELRYETIS